MTKPFTVTPTQHVGTKYLLAVEDDINVKLTSLSKQVETLALAKAATSLRKETLTMCALYDIMDHCTDVYPIIAGVKEARGQVNAVH